MSSKRELASPARLKYIDALRGIAASAVVLHHLLHNSVMEAPLRTVLPGAVETVMTWGARGVQVFFVLSGFVIVLSLRRTALNGRGATSFIARRQIRLDPTYWVMMVAAIALLAVERSIPGLSDQAMPDLSTFLANLFYLQNIVGAPQVVGVAWTLCIEIQFYLVLLLIAAGPRLLRAAARRPMPSATLDTCRPYLPWALAGTGAITLALTGTATEDAAFFMPFWHYFALGGLCVLARDGSTPRRLFFALAVLTAADLVSPFRPGVVTATVAGLLACAVLYLGSTGAVGLGWLGGNRVLQYLGSRSYTLYLVHLTVLSAVLRVGYKVTGASGSWAVAWLVLAAAASIGAAEVLHRLVERPSLRLAAVVKTRGLEAAQQRGADVPKRDAGVLQPGDVRIPRQRSAPAEAEADAGRTAH
jgi:peptidoglycan/LPS O-acetylase OafA/YrhL